MLDALAADPNFSLMAERILGMKDELPEVKATTQYKPEYGKVNFGLTLPPSTWIHATNKFLKWQKVVWDVSQSMQEKAEVMVSKLPYVPA